MHRVIAKEIKDEVLAKAKAGEKVPDYRTRLEFHRILGKLLGF